MSERTYLPEIILKGIASSILDLKRFDDGSLSYVYFGKTIPLFQSFNSFIFLNNSNKKCYISWLSPSFLSTDVQNVVLIPVFSSLEVHDISLNFFAMLSETTSEYCLILTR